MGVVGLFAVDAVGMVAHDATVDRRESYFMDCAGVRVGGVGAVETSEGWRKGVLMMDEEGSLDWLVNSTEVGPGISSARVPGSVGPWEVFSSSGRFLFTELTVAITSTEMGWSRDNAVTEIIRAGLPISVYTIHGKQYREDKAIPRTRYFAYVLG